MDSHIISELIYKIEANPEYVIACFFFVTIIGTIIHRTITGEWWWEFSWIWKSDVDKRQ